MKNWNFRENVNALNFYYFIVIEANYCQNAPGLYYPANCDYQYFHYLNLKNYYLRANYDDHYFLSILHYCYVLFKEK
jgi:hypothetical protein